MLLVCVCVLTDISAKCSEIKKMDSLSAVGPAIAYKLLLNFNNSYKS